MSPLAAYLVETIVTLLAVLAVAVLVLYGARRLGLGRPVGPLQLEGRLPLDGRRVIYLVRVADTLYVVGASEAGLHKLGELAGDQHVPEPRLSSPSFKEIWTQLLTRDRRPGPTERRPGPTERRPEPNGSPESEVSPEPTLAEPSRD